MTPGALVRIAATLALPFSLAAVVVMLLAALQARVVGAGQRARRLWTSVVTVVLAYAALLVGVSLASRQRVLEPGQEKSFCGLDCDLAFSVPKLLPAAPSAAGARAFYVTLRARSDARAESIRPGSVRAWLVSAGGRRFDPASGRTVPFRQAIAPGAIVDVALRFEVPANSRDLRLAVTEGGPMTRFVIGDENSLFHRKTLFRLPESS